MKSLKSCDLLGDKVNLKVEAKDTIKTQLGGLMTILTIISVLNLGWFIGQDIVFRENPFSFQQQSISIQTPNITLSAGTFPISISVYSKDSVVLSDSSFFTVELTHQKWRIENNEYLSDEISIPLLTCNQEHFPMISNETFTSLALDQVLCPSYESLNIFGSWSETQMSRLKVQIRMCDWAKPELNCKSEAEIKKYFQKNSPNLNLLFLDLQVNVKNYGEPIEYIPVYIDKYSQSGLLKTTYFNIQEQKLYTDSNIFVSSFLQDNFLKLVEQSTDISDFDEESKITNIFFLMSSNKYDSYYRKYIKFPEIIASVGGLMKAITLVMGFVVNFFSAFEFNNSLINKVYFKANDYSKDKGRCGKGDNMRRRVLSKFMLGRAEAKNSFFFNDLSDKNSHYDNENKNNFPINNNFKHIKSSGRKNNNDYGNNDDCQKFQNCQLGLNKEPINSKKVYIKTINKNYNKDNSLVNLNNNIDEDSRFRVLLRSKNFENSFNSQNYPIFNVEPRRVLIDAEPAKNNASARSKSNKELRTVINNSALINKKEESLSENPKEKFYFKKLNFSFKEKLQYLFCKCFYIGQKHESSRKLKLMHHGIKRINEHLEVSRIIYNFEEYKILKKIIFSEDQINLLEEILKKNLYLNVNKAQMTINFDRNINHNKSSSKATKRIFSNDKIKSHELSSSFDVFRHNLYMNMVNLMED